MGTDSFSGSGSRFNSRFVQGEEIYAKQLNDLAAGLQASLPTPYLGGGSSVSYIPGGSIITSSSDVGLQQQPYKPPTGGEVQLTIPNPEIPGIAQARIAKMSVITQDVWENNVPTTVEYYINGVWAYPTGSKTTGSVPGSVWMDSDGFISVANAANGGSDVWGVYIVRQPLNKSGQTHAPQVVVMAPSSDAFDKTNSFVETNDAILLFNEVGASPITIDGVASGNSIYGVSPNPYQYNYNCQRVIVAGILWDSLTSSWKITQYLSGAITLPNIIQHFGFVLAIDGSPSPMIGWPQFETQCDAWNGAWSGYSKASSSVSGPVSPPGFPF